MDTLKITVDERVLEVPKGTTLSSLLQTLNMKDVLTAQVDSKLVDLSSTLECSCNVKFFTFEEPEGREVFWHSSSHILGNALVNLYGAKLVNGPATEEGFYYDIDSTTTISTNQFKEIEDEMARLVKAGHKFEKVTKSKQELLEMYKENPCKTYFVNKNVDTETSVYVNDKFYDMCLGPHLSNTGKVKAFKLLKTSSAYFLNDSSNASLQRIYGISFPSKDRLKKYLEKLERAKEMDHRKIGNEMNLFFFHKYSPGSCFWLPDGAHIYNKLVEFMRSEYRKRGISEVITPNMFSNDIWKESGHYQNYKDNMYMVENEDFALKPMNCPGHCVMFRSMERSFRELPVRYADFGVLHRNEISGALSGLTRVRRFQQDDAHIFCMREQIQDEIAQCLDFLKFTYGIFGFRFELLLSTRPEKFLGEIEEWNEAEASLVGAIEMAGLEFKLNPGDGAFYGPKIDIVIYDALDRKWQCATIQLDFQLPQRFGLRYTASDGTSKTPVMVHRAILGSIERMIAMIVESFGKKLPFWLTPRQIALVPLFADEYAEKVKALLNDDFKVKVFDSMGLTLNKRIRNAETEGYRLVCILGEKEKTSGEINVRLGGSGNCNMKLEDFVEFVKDVADSKSDLAVKMLCLDKLSLN